MCTAVLVGDYDVVDFFNLDVLLVFYYDRKISISKNTVYFIPELPVHMYTYS